MEKFSKITNGFLLLLFLISIFIFLWNSLYFSPWIVDDAFISLRYSKNLMDGVGLVYNQGEKVEGFSNFLWVLLGSGFFLIKAPVITSLKFVGLMSGLSILILSSRLSIYMDNPHQQKTLKGITLLFLACNTSLALWCQSGLETTFFSLLILASYLLFEREISKDSPIPFSAIIISIAWMTRPETPVYLLYFLVRRIMKRVNIHRFDYLWIFTFLCIILPYEVWGFYYYGKILPNTYAAKIGNFGFLNFKDLLNFIFSQGLGFLILLTFSVFGIIFCRKKIPILIWTPILSTIIFVVVAGPDWMPGYRFFVPLYPFLGCVIAYGLKEIILRFRKNIFLFSFSILFFLATGLLYANEQFSGSFLRGQGKPLALAQRNWDWWKEVPKNIGQRKWPLEMMGLFVLAQTEPEDRVGLKDFGFPGFLSMNPVWDLAGLVTPATAKLRREGDNLEARKKYIHDFFQTGAATHIVIPRVPWPHIALQIQIFTTNPEFQEMYSFISQKDRATGSFHRFDPLFFGIPRGGSNILRKKDISSPSPHQILQNLENRLAVAVEHFPEYEPRAAELLIQIRRYFNENNNGKDQ